MFFVRIVAFGIVATLAAVGLAIGLYSDALHFIPEWLRAVLFFAFLILCVFGLLRLMRRPPSSRGVFTEAQLEAEGKIRKEEVRCRRAVEIAEFEDEGMHFLLELIDGRVLYLCGQHLYDLTEEKSPVFPSTSLQLKRVINGGFVTSVTSTGSYLAPSKKYPDFATAVIYEDWDVQDGDFLSLTFDQACAALDEKKANQSLEPTPPAVTDRACARSAPAGVVAHL
jgi:hypothetical protein